MSCRTDLALASCQPGNGPGYLGSCAAAPKRASRTAAEGGRTMTAPLASQGMDLSSMLRRGKQSSPIKIGSFLFLKKKMRFFWVVSVLDYRMSECCGPLDCENLIF